MSEPLFESQLQAESSEGKNILLELPHPYPRYGLAVALLQKQLGLDVFDLTVAPEALAEALETGLGKFRLETQDNPETTDVLRFGHIKFVELEREPKLVQSAGLASQGKYLAPSVVTTDGDAKGTYTKAVEMLKKLREGVSLNSTLELSRSFAPTTAKINNGRSSQSPPKGMLFEAACSAIATLTELKPAVWVDGRNTVIIPDLPLDELLDFVELFSALIISGVDGNLMEARLAPKQSGSPGGSATTQGNETRQPKKVRKKVSSNKPKSEYRRPRLYNGNYPFAPRDAAFGAAGLLGAIGKWAQVANKVEWARRVLESIAGTSERPGRPLYIISYDSISQVQFTHHVVGLSIEGKLSELIDSLIRDTMIFSEIENNKAKWDSPSYKLFYLMTSRFLQLFTPPAFRDFLATRAEYSPKVQPLFEEFFMNARKIDKEIVESARSLGQWLNRAAWIVADSEIEQNAPERAKKVRKEKAKILVEFESAAMSAKTAQDMLHRISTRAGRLLQRDLPAEATRFLDAAASGEIEPEDALHLLIAYLRLRPAKSEEDHSGNAGSSAS